MENIKPVSLGKTAIRSAGLMVVFTLIFGGLYPFLTTIFLEVTATHQSFGSVIKDKDGKIIGSELIGQDFSKPQYLWGRLSATTNAYNAAASSGSNLGVNNPALLDAVKGRIAELQKYPHDKGAKIPVDLVTASASGLDPEISPAAAYYQIPRIAEARNLPAATIKDAIDQSTKDRDFYLLGEKRVNVLMVNLKLDGKID